jgi:hypothetical protein
MFKRAFLGSLSSYLAHHADIPVVIAKTKDTNHPPAAPDANAK